MDLYIYDILYMYIRDLKNRWKLIEREFKVEGEVKVLRFYGNR